MDTEIARTLNALNLRFYEEFAEPFAGSRASIPAGLERALERLRGRRVWLDLGCGDGRVGRWLAHRARERPAEFPVERYAGVDFSRPLLAERDRARTDRSDPDPPFARRYLQADFTRDDWDSEAGLQARTHDAVVCFAVLFHLPGRDTRVRFLRRARELLHPDGRCILSVWQFQHVESMRSRIVPWSEVGIDPTRLEPHDLLVDWRRGGRGLRYVHHFEESDLRAACEAAGFVVHDAYRSDGRTGDLSLFVELANPTG